jgi:hypothetical protein
MDAEDHLAVDHHLLNICISQQVDADFAWVIQVVEQVSTHLGGIRQTRNSEHAIFFAHTEQHHTTMGIGHGGVGKPEILGDLTLTTVALRQLAFELMGFSKQVHILKRLQMHHLLLLPVRELRSLDRNARVSMKPQDAL